MFLPTKYAHPWNRIYEIPTPMYSIFLSHRNHQFSCVHVWTVRPFDVPARWNEAFEASRCCSSYVNVTLPAADWRSKVFERQHQLNSTDVFVEIISMVEGINSSCNIFATLTTVLSALIDNHSFLPLALRFIYIYICIAVTRNNSKCSISKLYILHIIYNNK